MSGATRRSGSTSSPKKSSPSSTKPDPVRLAAELDRQLRKAGNPTRAVEEKRYLKSDLAFYGCGLSADPTFERRIAAVIFLDSFVSVLTPDDIRLVERFIRESKTWVLVDELSGVVAGSLVERYPELNRRLDRWAVDEDFWVRRSALLALLRPLRRGGGDFARFGRYADRMLEEREFFIRKAIGWVLRETAKKQSDLVFEWLKPRVARTSGVTLREAVRWLPASQRDRLLATYKANRKLGSLRA